MRKREYQFYVYIMSNYERTAFYIGFTNDIGRRIIEHKLGIGSEFTKKYKLKYLIYFEIYQYVDAAISREKELKKWRREKKIELIKKENPRLKNLSRELLNDLGWEKEDIEEAIRYLKNER
jgi:putative endonuclease